MSLHIDVTSPNAPAKYHLAIAVTCFGCDVPNVALLWEGDIEPGQRVPVVELPEGWWTLDGKTYCERHKAEIVPA